MSSRAYASPSPSRKQALYIQHSQEIWPEAPDALDR